MVLASAAALVSLATPATAAGPAWVERTQVSADEAYVDHPAVTVDSQGNAVALWTVAESSQDLQAPGVLQAARRPAGGTWGAPETVGHISVRGSAHIAIDGSGTAIAVWLESVDGFVRPRVAERPAAGTWGEPHSISWRNEHAQRVRLDANDSGDAVIVFTEGPERRLHAVERRPDYPFGWSGQTSINSGEDAYGHQVAIDESGSAIVIWADPDDGVFTSRSGEWPYWPPPDSLPFSWDGHSPQIATDGHGNATAAWVDGNIYAASQRPNEVWSERTLLAPEPSDPQIRVAMNNSAEAVIAWGSGNSVEATARHAGKSWAKAETISLETESAHGPEVAIDDDGHALVAFGGGHPLRVQAVHLSPGGAWSVPTDISDSSQQGLVGNRHIATNASGDAAAVWVVNDGAHSVNGAMLTTSPPEAAVTKPELTRQSSTTFGAAWGATEWWSPVTSYDVRYRVAPWNGAFGQPTAWKSATTGKSATFAGVRGRSYCFSARARDRVDGEGPWSRERCTATPVDDRTLTASSSWVRATNSTYYEGTYTSTRTYGATLTRTGVQVKHLSLLATTCSGCGKVKVTFNGSSLGTFSLYSASTVKKKIITVKSFSAATTGTLKIQAVSPTGKSVYIDGVIVRRF